MADRLISCDDHMDLGQLPADLWLTRLPPELRDRAPRVEERDGQAVWIDRKSTRLNSSHIQKSRMPSSA